MEYDIKYLADFLENYNKWRRDKNVPSKIKMPSPAEIGFVIDLTVKELRKNDKR